MLSTNLSNTSNNGYPFCLIPNLNQSSQSISIDQRITYLFSFIPLLLLPLPLPNLQGNNDESMLMSMIIPMTPPVGSSNTSNASPPSMRRKSMILNKKKIKKTGHLFKKGNNIIKDWKQRWFVLYKHSLYYYDDPDDVSRMPFPSFSYYYSLR